jgi:hypothetical protein
MQPIWYLVGAGGYMSTITKSFCSAAILAVMTPCMSRQAWSNKLTSVLIYESWRLEDIR